jgi:hypothetical protein
LRQACHVGFAHPISISLIEKTLELLRYFETSIHKFKFLAKLGNTSSKILYLLYIRAVKFLCEMCCLIIGATQLVLETQMGADSAKWGRGTTRETLGL